MARMNYVKGLWIYGQEMICGSEVEARGGAGTQNIPELERKSLKILASCPFYIQ